MIIQTRDICVNLCAQIREIDRSRMHWRRNVIRLAASARHELEKLRLAARALGANRDGLLALIGRLEAELEQVLETHEKGGDRSGRADLSSDLDGRGEGGASDKGHRQAVSDPPQ